MRSVLIEVMVVYDPTPVQALFFDLVTPPWDKGSWVPNDSLGPWFVKPLVSTLNTCMIILKHTLNETTYMMLVVHHLGSVVPILLQQ